MISLTERASVKVRELMAADVTTAVGLRVGVRPGGCAGYEYSLAFSAGPEEGDIVVAEDGFEVFVSSRNAALLGGTRIDYVEGLQGAGFVFNNPNAVSGCGCGKSFDADVPEGEAADAGVLAQVAAALEGVRPLLQAEGGDVELVDMRGGTVKVRLAGACAGCGMAQETLRHVIERRLQQAVPAVQRVVAI